MPKKQICTDSTDRENCFTLVVTLSSAWISHYPEFQIHFTLNVSQTFYICLDLQLLQVCLFTVKHGVRMTKIFAQIETVG